MQLYIHKLETQANELQYFKAKNTELLHEIQVYKHKVDPTP